MFRVDCVGQTQSINTLYSTGFYCSGGTADKVLCTAAAGRYCQAGSSSQSGILCPAGFYCSGGSNAPAVCNTVPGFYCPVGMTAISGTLCPAGYFCHGGATDKIPCAVVAGTFCPEGSSSPGQSPVCASDKQICLTETLGVSCPAGYYCFGGSSDKAPCTALLGKYCPENSTSVSVNYQQNNVHRCCC